MHRPAPKVSPLASQLFLAVLVLGAYQQVFPPVPEASHLAFSPARLAYLLAFLLAPEAYRMAHQLVLAAYSPVPKVYQPASQLVQAAFPLVF